MSKFLASTPPKLTRSTLTSLASIASISSSGTNGSALTSNGEGRLVWATSLPAKQKDIYLTAVDITLPIKHTAWTELVIPLYKDGSFSLTKEVSVVKVELSFTYGFVNNSNHLPFALETRINGEPTHSCEYGQDGSTKLQDTGQSLATLVSF